MIAQRICDAVRDNIFEYKSKIISLTISAGVSGIEKTTERGVIDRLIFRADKGLYDAKNMGRDRVCLRLNQ